MLKHAATKNNFGHPIFLIFKINRKILLIKLVYLSPSNQAGYFASCVTISFFLRIYDSKTIASTRVSIYTKNQIIILLNTTKPDFFCIFWIEISEKGWRAKNYNQ
jgi:hypothetical protein